MIDIAQESIQQVDYQIARKYWNKLKQWAKKESSQLVTNCHRLKLTVELKKYYLTDVAKNTRKELETKMDKFLVCSDNYWLPGKKNRINNPKGNSK